MQIVFEDFGGFCRIPWTGLDDADYEVQITVKGGYGLPEVRQSDGLVYRRADSAGGKYAYVSIVRGKARTFER